MPRTRNFRHGQPAPSAYPFSTLSDHIPLRRPPLILPGQTVLFQGDSITDSGRNREESSGPGIWALGNGYAKLAAAHLLAARPSDGLAFLNRGISGNRVVDLYARILADTINLKPDVLSVLIGVNDTWHRFRGNNGVAVPKFERVFRDYLTEARAALPGIRFVLCEPFVLGCGHVTSEWVGEMDARRAVVRRLASEFGAVSPFRRCSMPPSRRPLRNIGLRTECIPVHRDIIAWRGHGWRPLEGSDRFEGSPRNFPFRNPVFRL